MSDPYKAATEKLVSCIVTVQQFNTDEWMDFIVNELNGWAEATGDPDRVKRLHGGLTIVRSGNEGEKS